MLNSTRWCQRPQTPPLAFAASASSSDVFIIVQPETPVLTKFNALRIVSHPARTSTITSLRELGTWRVRGSTEVAQALFDSWCVGGTLGCARAIVHELPMIGLMDGGKRFIVACVVIPASRSPRRWRQSRGRQSS